MKSNTVILLTACVNPNGMTKTIVQDCEIRQKQYEQALLFYLSRTSYKVVVVENSGVDFSRSFKNYILSGRLEYIMFMGNDFDKSLGKGFGEMQILRYAFQKSVFILHSERVVKITGRLIVENINLLLLTVDLMLKKQNEFVAGDISMDTNYAISQFFVGSKAFFLEDLLPKLGSVNDEDAIYFENILADSIKKWQLKGKRFYVLMFPITIDGVSGTFGHKLPRPTLFYYLRIFVKSIYFNFINRSHFK